MEPLEFEDLPHDTLLVIDSAPIIYVLEAHPKFGPRFKPLFEAHSAGRFRFAVTTITVAEGLTGPLQAGPKGPAPPYSAIFVSWHAPALSTSISAKAPRFPAFLSPSPAE